MSEIATSSRQGFNPADKPLTSLNNAPETDCFGFTPNEKMALKNLMRVVKRQFRHHAFSLNIELVSSMGQLYKIIDQSMHFQLVYSFFATNDTLLNRFRRVGKFNLEVLNQHPFNVLRMFDAIITQGFDNINYLKALITRIEKTHAVNCVSKEEMAMMTNAVRSYFLGALQPICSPTVAVGLEKVGLVIQQRFKD